MGEIILDTNVVLDLLVFRDPTAEPLRQALAGGSWVWLATPRMRDELARVLDYAHIAPRLQFHGLSRDSLLQAYDAQTRTVDSAGKCPFHCKDPDDQHFIDLAVARRALLLSKDHAVLALRKRVQVLCGQALIGPPSGFESLAAASTDPGSAG